MSPVHFLSWFALFLGAGSMVWLALAVALDPPRMPVMTLVWPLTGLFAGPLAVVLYHRYGHRRRKPFAASVAIAAFHCGSGCTLGDFLAEGLVAVTPAILVWFGLGSIFHNPVAPSWVLDTLLAVAIGVGFQYAALRPLSADDADTVLVRALKSDALSLAAWQVGMIGLMAWVQFDLARRALSPSQPEFWFAMQMAMLAGFVLAYPVNWFLLRSGIKAAI